ncbi:MAG: hypothetical protein IT170_04120 [Bryobacterales bacterium]|nr:hypothetical protein [Bryobacterales bacterium]
MNDSTKDFQVRIVRRHASNEDHPHEIEPTYANYFFCVRLGTDVFLDVCVLPPDDLIAAQSPDASGGEIRIVTIERFVMGLNAFQQLAEQVKELAQKLTEQNLLPVEPVVKTTN